MTNSTQQDLWDIPLLKQALDLTIETNNQLMEQLLLPKDFKTGLQKTINDSFSRMSELYDMVRTEVSPEAIAGMVFFSALEKGATLPEGLDNKTISYIDKFKILDSQQPKQIYESMLACAETNKNDILNQNLSQLASSYRIADFSTPEDQSLLLISLINKMELSPKLAELYEGALINTSLSAYAAKEYLEQTSLTPTPLDDIFISSLAKIERNSITQQQNRKRTVSVQNHIIQ